MSHSQRGKVASLAVGLLALAVIEVAAIANAAHVARAVMSQDGVQRLTQAGTQVAGTVALFLARSAVASRHSCARRAPSLATLDSDCSGAAQKVASHVAEAAASACPMSCLDGKATAWALERAGHAAELAAQAHEQALQDAEAALAAQVAALAGAHDLTCAQKRQARARISRLAREVVRIRNSRVIRDAARIRVVRPLRTVIVDLPGNPEVKAVEIPAAPGPVMTPAPAAPPARRRVPAAVPAPPAGARWTAATAADQTP